MMKKIISVLLAVMMVLAMAPISAMADNATVDNDVVFDDVSVSSVDYSAYNSIVELVEALDEKEYTADSIANIKSKVVNKDSLKTQEQINAAVTEIAIAYAQLEKNSFSVSFIIINSKGERETEKHTYFYGDTASFNVDNGEELYKWTVSDIEGDTKINTSENDFSLVIDKACTVIAYTDTKPEEKHKLQQIKFLSFNGKLIDIEYVESLDELEMPEAPALPFYYFSEWVQLNDNTYQAKYLSETICDGQHHRFTTMVAKAGCETVGYVIFQCSCGEAYGTDYSSPVGHQFDHINQYCLNGCGKLNPNMVDESSEPTEPSDSQETTTPAKPEADNKEYGFDEGGYNNMVIAP